MERMPEEHSARDGASRRGTSVECEAEMIRLRPAQAASDPRFSQLARMIEQEIIPRLMLAHRALPDPVLRQAGPAHAIGADDVKQFAKLVLSHEEDVAFGAVQSLRARDVSIERIYLDLLAPTARYLGELWEEDLCNFTDVTVGLGRLQRVLRELSPELGKSVDHPDHGRRVLLLPCPGEQHTFGLVMVAEFFRMASWDVTGGAWAADTDAAALVESEWFDVVVSGSLANLFQIVSPVPHILFVSACGLSTVALFVIAWRRTPARTDDLQHTVGRMNLAAGLIVAVQAITALVYPVDLINQLQVIRAGMWLNIFAYLWFARYLIEREELLSGDRRLSLLRALYIASPLPLVPALIWWPARRFTRETASLILMAIVAVGLIGGAMAVVLPYGLWRPGFYPYGPTTEWEAIQRCARELTPRDALFITPPEKWGLYDSDWRTFSERSTLATHDELLMIALAPIHYDTWKERFAQVAPGALEQFNSNFFDAQRASRDAYNGLSAEQIQAVAQRYGVDFVVREVPNTLPWQALNCDNSQYVIYEVP
jgi:hypothetical protein